MKLYLITDFKKGDYLEEAEDSSSIGTTHRNMDQMHGHERYQTLDYFIKYKIFNGLCRNGRQNHEYQLVEIPDELVFQYMLLGLKDLDFICYNHETKRVIISNSANNASYYAGSDYSVDDSESSNHAYGGHVGYAKMKKDAPMFDFYLRDDEKTERDPFLFEPDLDVYSDFVEVLMPYVHNLYRQNLITALYYLKYEDFPIGPRTKNIGDGRMVKADYDEIKKLNVPGDELVFLFQSYFDDDEFWIASTEFITKNDMEIMRCYAMDIHDRFYESTGSEWDIER